ncbi:hypothetical protein HQQ80_06820 [Microbacteriaceae bacterium VKM Ac-2855]|nr:hypothetical protein [Microbacteriaceae bacterium VKM Ac-2855]
MSRALPVRRRALLRLVPWWFRVLLVFAASRIVTTVILLAFAAQQGANPWTNAAPNYFDYATMWDGRWYNIIAVWGYPSTLPVTDAGQIGENAWAFMPLYPFVVRGLMLLTGMSWAPAAVLISVLCGAGTALVAYRMFRHSLGESQALFAVLLLCVAPTSPLFQLAYAESMQFLLLATALLLLIRRRWAWLVPVVLLLGLTRPSGLAFAAALAFYTIVRWLQRSREPFPRSQWLPSLLLTGWSLAVGFLWPAIAWVFTGDPAAYTETELAWRSAYIGYQELFPFTAWFQGLDWWFGQPWGALLVVALILTFFTILAGSWTRRLDIESRSWIAGYAFYLFTFWFPQSSTFRILAPMFPILGALAVPRNTWFRILLVLVGIGGQIVWITICWGVDGSDWTPP